ncbi:MAG: nucleotide sugar dehydrogenase [Planctomycetes bacterium]|nr:nucleotide sugar dehydrogenase [Planctomycetota bacterium]
MNDVDSAREHPVADLIPRLSTRATAVAVVGLGYVGLPLALCLAKKFDVLGFDIDAAKLARFKTGIDDTGEIDEATLRASSLRYSAQGDDLRGCHFFIVCVPTPVDQAKRPDFRPLLSACRTIGPRLAKGAVVVFESTVYPGATEEVCVPALERESGLKAGRDFFFGYSPERINPGDKTHTIDRVVKVVSGSDAVTLDAVAGVYGAAITAGVYKAPNVKTAEAAKVIENTQRDLNIALVNELALIFHRIGLDTVDVLETAGTKWNFLPFRPGLVGGHCIGVDPYYLTHKAEEVGYHPQVILAGRRINDGMGQFIARECIRLMIHADRPVKGASVLVLGLTFKEDVPDVRNTRVVDIVDELRAFGAVPVVIDPVADPAEAKHEYGIELAALSPLPRCAGVIAAVAHRELKALALADLAAAAGAGAPFIDVKSAWDRDALAAAGFTVWRL